MKVRGENYCLAAEAASETNLRQSVDSNYRIGSQPGSGQLEASQQLSRSMRAIGYKIEELAQIRLNVASLEQFIAASCGLADDNSAIKERVYEAAREARAAALLIDHLRNLFSHQRAIEWHAGSSHSDSSHHLFTYSNQLTLVRAAKSLAANVGKILFLTDSVVLQEPQSRHSDSHLDKEAQSNFELAERLDNVANYSHLVRSFGELASELVDLGRRILLSTEHNNQQHHHWSPIMSPLPDDGGEAQLPRQEGQSSFTSALENDIQNMQSLFQVNRLIIDRLIILLLTASKCCLRPNESFHGLQVRRSVVRQIRASISIIMAIVKRSIFGGQWCEEAAAGAAGSQLEPAPHTMLDPTANEFGAPTSDFRSLQLATDQPSTGHHHYQHNDNTTSYSRAQPPVANSAEKSDRPTLRDNQIDYRRSHYLSCQSALPFPANPTQLQSAARNQNMESREVRQACYQLQEPHHNHANKLHTFHSLVAGGHSSLAAPNLFHGQPANLGPANNQTNKHQYPQPPQIMNYFLESNAMSVHKAINRLQLLVGLLTQVADCKSLVETLNFTLESVELSAKKKLADCLVLDKENCGLMSKRKLSAALNTVFLGELNAVLEERAYEFTDCAYTRHEHRETILLLLRCLRLQLNRLVKLIYRLCRRTPAAPAPSLIQLRQLASQIDETCAELKYELQSVVIEQSDELDRCNAQLDLVRQLKQHCLVGDEAKTAMARAQFGEQAERLIELCRMLNQVAPTHKMRIATRTLSLWFRSNLSHLLALAQALAAAPHARGLKDCTWLYIQVWCSFYDDFCQLARQLAYVTHAHYNPDRSRRVAAIRDQVLQRHQLELSRMEGHGGPAPDELLPGVDYAHTGALLPGTCLRGEHPSDPPLHNPLSHQHQHQHQHQPSRHQQLVEEHAGRRPLNQAASLQSLTGLDQQALVSATGSTDSPRSLDHYYGFGPNYHRQRARLQHPSSSPHPEQYHEDQQGPIDDTDDWSDAMASNSPWQLAADFNNNQSAAWKRGQPDSCCSSSSTSTTTARFHGGGGPATSSPPPPPASIAPPAPELCWNRPAPDTRRSVTIDESAPQVYSDSDERRDSSVSCKRDEEPDIAASNAEQQSEAAAAAEGGLDADKWSDSDADAIVRGARETAQMALSMYQFTRGEGELNTTQDLFTQAELFAEEANELYKEVRCFSYKVPSGDLKKQLLAQLATIPALVQQLQFIVKNPTVGKPATFAKVDGVIRETRTLMEAVNRVVTATLSCRQHYNMASASMRKRTRTLSPSYRADTGSLEFESHISGSGRQNSGSGAGGAMGGRHGTASMGSEPDI